MRHLPLARLWGKLSCFAALGGQSWSLRAALRLTLAVLMSERAVDMRVNLGVEVRAERRKRGWPLEVVAKRAGLTRAQVAAFEQGDDDLSYTEVIQLVRRGLDADIDELIDRAAARVDP